MSSDKKRPLGTMPCPVCHGKGSILEDSNEYSFVTRDPDTFVCLTCMGAGYVGPRKKLKDGSSAYEHAKGLNVSAKAKVVENTESADVEMDKEGAIDVIDRLRKVLKSGKQFLIVTETEPYYFDVYRMIRDQERKQETWSEQDEEAYVEALEVRIKELDSRLRGNDRLEGASGERPYESGNDKTNKEAVNG